MERNLCIKCNKCSSIMKFNITSKAFLCSNCNNINKIEDISNDNIIINNDNNLDESFKNIKCFPSNYSKTDFINNIQQDIKFKTLIPKEFKKLKKLNESDINKLYLPFEVYNGIVALLFENSITFYDIKDMIIDEFIDVNYNIVDMMYPLDLDSKTEIYENNCDNILSNIHSKDLIKNIEDVVKKNLILEDNLELENDDINIVFIKEKIDIILLPIYDYIIRFDNKEYHLSMNANTGKCLIKIPTKNTKIITIIISFLLIDIIFFFLSQLVRMIDEFVIGMSIVLLVIQFLIIWCLYLLSKNTKYNYSAKNKSKIKKI